ncbi:MAG: PsiF family protein [Zoogloeaceae bacterium]|nr:PsiF family protein [Zoogloeaceae bacterium]
MKRTLLSLCAALSLSLSVGLAQAADTAAPKKEPTPAQKAQREKMKACNQEAKAQSLKGEARKAFMKQCLSTDVQTKE